MNSEFGIIGMGVMGKSLSRNMAAKGYKLSLYNRYLHEVEENVAQDFISGFAELKDAKGFEDMEAFVASLQKPRKILLMVNAGKAVDLVLDQLTALLEEGDTVIDGGNSHYHDTDRRYNELKIKHLHFVGLGISGGEAGALSGPSMMPGGSRTGYNLVESYLTSIAARDKWGNPCCSYMGKGGAGHFVKMVHNGIEYAEMQLLAEVYDILGRGQNRNPEEVADVLKLWLTEDLNSYLLEITVNILRKKDGEDFVINHILDVAGSKGTGSWTSIAAAEMGVPITMISAALQARFLSDMKVERVKAHQLLGGDRQPIVLNALEVKSAYHLARLVNHQQGMQLMQKASEEFGWELNLSEIARVWTNGCIIRSELMETLVPLLAEHDNLIFSENIQKAVSKEWDSLCRVAGLAMRSGLHIPCLTAAINYLNGYTSAQSSANLIQAQRDYFGAHTYQHINDPQGPAVHTIWES